MIRFIEITNYKNEKLKIDIFNPYTSALTIRKIDGLAPVKADITTTKMVVADGDYYNSARANGRNIVLTLGFMIVPELGIRNIEDCRHMVYKYFPLKKRLKFSITTDSRELYTYGYVESNDVDIFSKDETTQISLICPDSWLKTINTNEVPINNVKSLFKFPFEVLEDDLPPKDIYGSEKEDGLKVVKEYQDTNTFYGNDVFDLYDNKNMYMDLENNNYSNLIFNYTYEEIKYKDIERNIETS